MPAVTLENITPVSIKTMQAEAKGFSATHEKDVQKSAVAQNSQ
jgi:hypothetical protein